MDESATAEEFWEARYREHTHVWSGRPNALLVAEVEGLAPGAALDLGCGEGGDAVWLAGRGWRVTAVDVSATALARVAEHAEEAGVGDRVRTEWHDLDATFPAGTYDLVSACYLHSPDHRPRVALLRSAAAAVDAGGTLVVVDHSRLGPWAWDPDRTFEAPEQVWASLALPADAWEVERAELVERVATGPDGVTAAVVDGVLRARRLA